MNFCYTQGFLRVLQFKFLQVFYDKFILSLVQFLVLGFFRTINRTVDFTDVHLAKLVRPVKGMDLLRCLEAFLKGKY